MLYRLRRMCAASAVAVSFAALAAGLAHAQQQGLMPSPDAATRYLTPLDRTMTLGAANVRVRIEGPADAPVVLLVHGFTFSLETWDKLAADLAQDHRVIRFDLMGHGLTGADPAQRYSPAERATTIRDLLDNLGVARASIVGSSLGGLAAWRFAADAPARVDRLVLLSPGAYPINGVGDAPAPVPPALAAYLLDVPEAAFRFSLARIYARPDALPPERIQTIYDMMRLPGNGAAFVQSIEEFTLPDPSAALGRISAPTLILWGVDDQVIPVEHAGRLREDIPDAQLIVYPAAGHLPHEEAPGVIRDIRAFLTKGTKSP